eukprot:TRINITY_DN8831_c0_g1_i2.p1 TRINITY_DN8831_c0_g1~~TRINITY_DN8831_c0_g1_i2.p1  ORF type:complete len:399 (+),score=64.26 TRINITY_DN8831_c0_g1_i2:221-1417(+)
MFSYVSELVGGSTGAAGQGNVQSGLTEILGAGQKAGIEGHRNARKDSYKALQTVLEQQKKLSKKWRTYYRGGYNSVKVGGLDMLLGEDIGFGLAGIKEEETDDEQNVDKDNSAGQSTLRDTAYEGQQSGKPKAAAGVIKLGGQYRRCREDWDIAESVRMSLPGEESSTGDGGRAMSVRSEGFQLTGNRTLKFLEQQMKGDSQFGMSRQMLHSQSSPGMDHREAIPTTIETYLRDLEMNNGEYDELPPDFEVKSVVSDTQSMPEFKRSRSPVARPMPMFDFDSFDENDPEQMEILKRYYRRSVGVDDSDVSSQSSASQVRSLAAMMERRSYQERLQQRMSMQYANAAKAPKLKRQIHVADKVNSFRGTVKGPTAMYVPPTPRKASDEENTDKDTQQSSS